MAKNDILVQLNIDHDFEYRMMDHELHYPDSYKDILYSGRCLASMLAYVKDIYSDEYINKIPELLCFTDLIETMIYEVKRCIGIEPYNVYLEDIYARLFIVRIKAKDRNDTNGYKLYKSARSRVL